MYSKFGPKPRFDEIDVWKVLQVLSNRRFGRKKIARKTGIGEGSVRSIISLLGHHGLVKRSRSGVYLTQEGEKEIKKLRVKLVDIDAKEFRLGKEYQAAIIRDKANKVTTGIEERDDAIRHGATGAVTLVYKNGKLQLPPQALELQNTYPNLWKQIDVLGLQENDVVVICAATDKGTATNACISVGLKLCKVKFK